MPAEPFCQLLSSHHLKPCLQLDQAALGGLWNPQQWRTELEDPRRPCLGLLEGEALLAVACGWLVVDELHITAVAVDPVRQRQGLGRQVLLALLQHGHNLGAIHATLEVSAANAAGCALYARSGFSTAGVRRAYYRNGDDALIQWRRLDDADFNDSQQVRITAHS